jgi:replicative DNA helicase
VIIVAARPSIGKTAYVLSELRHQSYTMEVPTAFVSLDSMRRNIMFRLFAQTAQVDVKKMRIGFLNQDELDRLQYAKSLHERKKLIVDDIPMNIADIRTRVKRMKLKYDIQILAVDFVQLVGGSGKRNQTREREVSEVSLMLKNVAKEFELTTILLSQLNRAVDYRPDKRPILADLRDSGSLEQDADIVLFLSRPEYYGEEYFDKEKRFPAKNKAEVIIAKGRDVGTGAFKLEFEKSCAHFKNIADSSVIIDIPNNPGTQRYEYEEKNHNYGYDDDEAPF